MEPEETERKGTSSLMASQGVPLVAGSPDVQAPPPHVQAPPPDAPLDPQGQQAQGQQDGLAAIPADAVGGSAAAEPLGAPPEGGEGAALAHASDEVGLSAAPGGTVQSGAQDPAGKKRRRKRKRKGKSAAGDVTSPGHEEAARRDTVSGAGGSAHAPFLAHLHAGSSAHHAFSAGELVAGRVLGPAADGTLRIDLFGKALAILDAREPREVVPDPEKEPRFVMSAAPTGAPVATAPVKAAAASEAAVPSEVELPVTEAEVARAAESPSSEAGAQSVAIPPDAMASEALAGVSAAPPAVEGPAPERPAAPLGVQAEEASISGNVPGEPAVAEAVPPARDPDEDFGEPLSLPPGTIFRGRVASVSESGHVAIVNRYVDRAAAKATLRAASEAKARVLGVVFGFNRGGFDVVAKGIRVFCPASGMDLGDISDPTAYVGQRFEFLVPPKKGKGGSYVVSRRSILERAQRGARKARLRSLQEGEVLTGVVTQVREFGAFVDVGDGLEGLVHQSELSWNRTDRPDDVVKPGDALEVKVLRVGPEPSRAPERSTPSDGGDPQKRRRDKTVRVSLSRKALLPDPWDLHEDKLKAGHWQEGRIVRTTEFGAFVELAPGLEALLHISELGQNLSHAKQAVAEGDLISVVVERVDRGQRRVSLSRLLPNERQALEAGTLNLQERAPSTRVGAHLKVQVDRVEHGGVTVLIKGLVGKRGRGFLPNRELGSYSTGDKRRRLAPGLELDVKVAALDRDGSLRLSVKGFENDEERKAVREYRKETSSQGLGTFGDLLRAKLGDGTS